MLSFTAEQHISLPHPQGRPAALQFVRQPQRALSNLDFLRDLRLEAGQLRGELLIQVPLLGQVDLPFCSRLEEMPDGARLLPQALEGERAWVEVTGQARVDQHANVQFDFQFLGQVRQPPALGWGSAAFEKMVQAAAQRTLERISAGLPAGLRRNMQEG